MAANASTLEGFELFAGLSPDALGPVGELAKVQQVACDTSLFRLGEEAEKFYLVRRGRVVLTLPMEVLLTEQEAFVEKLKPGSLLGWSALVRPYKYTMSARATVDSELLCWQGEELRELLRRQPSIGAPILENLTTLICHRLHTVQAMWVRELQRTLATAAARQA